MIMKNKGMILEKILNLTIDFYWKNNIAICHKKNLDIQFKKVNDDLQLEKSYISRKSTVDYYGIYKGIFLAFEAKSTNENKLSLNIIPKHQINYLKKINQHFGCAFFVILFKTEERFFLISIDKIDFAKQKSLTIEYLTKNGFELMLTYPGIIDFVEFIDKML
ncbi:Holliday junction resolvase recU [Mesomycoplasma hyorhinis HUB-1]|uniref:Holliday junction resolvase RecU n=1 Tax=Mesomycoplasma hyorhinis TaxID=2100 RepID=UPI0001E13392|nr:Holliday junction resolvase recU [Mesomycoplasma hyorhinis HUB-1]